MKIYLVGDLHGRANTIDTFCKNAQLSVEEENWAILLGDAGCLYYMNYKDHYFKQRLCSYPLKYFVIRGNHEERASNCAKNDPTKWEEVELFGGKCLWQPEYPNIYYAADEGGIYDIDGRKTLVIPGAYSVDKWYRLQNGLSWFPDEQLTAEEMAALEKKAVGQHFNLVLSHTCPWSKMPTDLFLSCINQSTVDNSMEHWMESFLARTSHDLHFWGHYHGDRLEAPYCEMFYREVESLEEVEARWRRFRDTGELDWWLPKSPSFYKGVYNELEVLF